MKKQQYNQSDWLWGVEAIAQFIERSKNQTHYLIRTKRIPVERLGPKLLLGRKSKIARALGGRLPESTDA